MIDVARIAAAIRMIESNGVDNAIGDDGQALGPYQQHPAFFWQWADRPSVTTKWADWFHQATTTFLSLWADTYPTGGPIEAAIVYHRHGFIRPADPTDYTADDYAHRFTVAYSKCAPSS